MIFDFSPVGILVRRCLPVVALCCLLPAAMAAPPKPAPATPAPPTAAPAAPPNKMEAIKQAVQAVYDAEDTALVAHDLDGVMAMYTSNVVFFDSLKGQQDVGAAGARKAWVTFFQVPHQTLTAARHEIKEVTVNKSGTGATVQAVHHLTITGPTESGTASVTHRDSTLRCFWTKKDGKWLIRQERILGVDTFVDGKRVQHNHKQVPT